MSSSSGQTWGQVSAQPLPIYAERFRGEAQLRRIQDEAQTSVSAALAASSQ